MKRVSPYAYSRGAIGTPSVLVAVAWVAIWLLWPSFDLDHHRLPGRRPGGADVAYAVATLSLHMSPLLFARATRVGFQAPHDDALDNEPADDEATLARLRFLHVRPPTLDWEGMKTDYTAGGDRPGAKWMDGYQPVWEHATRFTASDCTNRIVVDVRGALRQRAYGPGAMALSGLSLETGQTEVEAFVELDAAGIPSVVILESRSGNGKIDADVVRALERGRGKPGDAAVSGRVRMTIRSAYES